MVRLRVAVRRVSEEHSAWGYAKVAKLLRDEGWKVGRKLLASLHREMGLRVPKRKPKRRRRGGSAGVFPTVAMHCEHVWTWDFATEGLAQVEDKTVTATGYLEFFDGLYTRGGVAAAGGLVVRGPRQGRVGGVRGGR